MEVLKAINAVSAAISKIGIAKDRRAQADGSYNYRGIDDYLNALSPLLAQHQLIVIPQYIECKSVEVARTQKGNPILQASVTGEFHLFGIDGSTVVAVVTGEARDSSDKAVNKAMSVAYKYMAAQVFCIPFVGMEDSDAAPPEEPVMHAISAARVDEMIAQINATPSLENLRQFYDANAAELSTDEAAYAKVFAATKARKAVLKAA